MQRQGTPSNRPLIVALTVLVLVQAVLFLSMWRKIDSVHEKLLLQADAGAAPVPDELAGTESITGLMPASEALLRRIIREELAAQGVNDPETERSGNNAVAPTDPADTRDRRDSVARQIDYYASLGEISDKEMLTLQAEIAKLDPSGRREMLGKLTRALNSGAIRGHL